MANTFLATETQNLNIGPGLKRVVISIRWPNTYATTGAEITLADYGLASVTHWTCTPADVTTYGVCAARLGAASSGVCPLNLYIGDNDNAADSGAVIMPDGHTIGDAKTSTLCIEGPS